GPQLLEFRQRRLALLQARPGRLEGEIRGEALHRDDHVRAEAALHPGLGDRELHTGDRQGLPGIRDLDGDPRWAGELRARIRNSLDHEVAPFLPPATAINISAEHEARAGHPSGPRAVHGSREELRGGCQAVDRAPDLRQGGDHLPRPLTAEAGGIGAGPVDALEAGGQLLLDARDFLGRLTQLARHTTDLLDIHPLDGVPRWVPLSFAHSPALCSGGAYVVLLSVICRPGITHHSN